VYYASMLRCWHLVWILIRTDHPCLGVGCHTAGGGIILRSRKVFTLFQIMSRGVMDPASSSRAPCHETQEVEPEIWMPQCIRQQLRADRPPFWLLHGDLLYSLDVADSIAESINDFNILEVRGGVLHCNTPGVTIVATVYLQFYLQWLVQYKPSSREMSFSIIEVWSFEVN
jgi:hypothetical protein